MVHEVHSNECKKTYEDPYRVEPVRRGGYKSVIQVGRGVDENGPLFVLFSLFQRLETKVPVKSTELEVSVFQNM